MSRSRSPRHGSGHRHQQSVSGNSRRKTPERLPFQARKLHKSDLETYRSLLSQYLDVQKRLDINELDRDEVKGRWKSFLGKWNRGELAEGWYRPATKQKADEDSVEVHKQKYRPVTTYNGNQQTVRHPAVDEDEDDDEFGPMPPPAAAYNRSTRITVPNLQDLEYRKELAQDDRLARIDDLRYERTLDRRAQKERLEDMAPRADPGSRERQLEKKRERTDTVRLFRDAKEAGDVEVAEGDIMGDDGIEGYRAKSKAAERQKNEREIRKEEVLRARAAEREERLAENRAKEERTMDTLRALAKQNFGGGNG